MTNVKNILIFSGVYYAETWSRGPYLAKSAKPTFARFVWDRLFSARRAALHTVLIAIHQMLNFSNYPRTF
jgi:hypothetical protein